MTKKIIFINRFYRPDNSATSQILTDLTLKLRLSGAEIHVIASRQLYVDCNANLPACEDLDGIRVHRAWTSSFGRANLIGRAFDYLSFYITSLFLMLKLVKRGDVLIAKTDPPIISVIAAVVAKLKGASLINWVQDLFPEIAVALGVGALHPWVVSIIKGVRNWSLRIASVNVVIGPAMKEKIQSEIGGADNVMIIPNWVVGKEIKPILKEENHLVEEWGLAGKFVIGYSGNLGRAHDYQTILGAAEKLEADANIIFLLIGGGAGYELLKKSALGRDLKNIIFKPYLPIELLSYGLSASDVHLVSLEPALEGLILPSKFYGILSVGRPILNLGSEKGDIGTEISETSCGYTIEIGDVDALVDRIKKFSESVLQDYQNKVLGLYKDKYAPELSINCWRKTINDCLEG